MRIDGYVGYSDLPEDHSTVLLLGVTRIPTSPLPARRPCTLPLDPNNSLSQSTAQVRRTSFSTRRQHVARRSSSVKGKGEHFDDSGKCGASYENTSETVMERSVDSIGTCSLDVEASADLSDWSEASSAGTLRSETLSTPTPEHHLPSYLSLACTVNGYSTSINYDPIRLARSRDASPHRFDNDNLTPRNTPTYTLQNNLLSPPNLVPLPTHIRSKMSQKANFETLKESQYLSKDTIDACYNYDEKLNGRTTQKIEEYSKTETKSFIQQRVERLYGPGALAQGFFTKRLKDSDSDAEVSVTEKIQNGGGGESPLKQSNSSPALPVLRHLRPEFRAQLPIIWPRKGTESLMQKSSTIPTLKDEATLNGHSKQASGSEGGNIAQNAIIEESGEKDGHYFLKILQNETNRLLKLAENIENELGNGELGEEIEGKIHSAAGKARLLVTQKMQQFKGLCTNNITQGENEVFPTTSEDLQGFWDMVMLQVNQVDALFREIQELKANNWKEVKKEPVNKPNMNGKQKKMVVNKAKSSVNEETRKKREAERRQLLEERRKAMKVLNQKTSVEIFVPESS